MEYQKPPTAESGSQILADPRYSILRESHPGILLAYR